MSTLVHGKMLRDLRVSKGTGLTVGIASGNFSLDGTDVYYAGSSSEAVVDASTNYIEIDDTGTISINQAAFTPGLLPLATVVTAGGVVTAITDKRPFLSKGGTGGGGGGSSSTWKNGTPTGAIDDVNDTFTLPDTPDPESLILVLDGQVLNVGPSNDYTLTGDTITFTTPPETGSTLVYFYTTTTSYFQTGGGLTFQEITSTGASMAAGNGYITNNASRVHMLLPTSAQLGQVFAVAGKGAGGWRITQNAGQTIWWDADNTTTGVSGYIESTSMKQVIYLLCIQANTDFEVLSVTGTPTVV